MLKFLFYIFFILNLRGLIFTSELPKELLGINIGEKFYNLKKLFQLKSVKKENFEKIYKVIYSSEETNFIETYVSFFNSQVSKIKVLYNENFIDENDWENIFNQAVSYYGVPNKVEIETQNDITTEFYLWENENIKYEYLKISKNDKILNFSIILRDKKIEQKILNLSPIKKFLYKIF
ncbi:MAG: hypothetical protein ACK4WJ_03090 [Endomicrobiia bacterium]